MLFNIQNISSSLLPAKMYFILIQDNDIFLQDTLQIYLGSPICLRA